MQNKSPIKERILEYIEHRGITKYEFYKRTGITRGILDQENGITESNITKFLTHFKEVNLTWLLNGTGNFYLDSSEINIELNNQPLWDSVEKTPNPPKSNLRDSDNTLKPLVPTDKLSRYLKEGVAAIGLECAYLNIALFNETGFYVTISDMAMEPKYSNGDIIACIQIGLNEFIQWNKIYLMDTPHGVFVRRILPGKDAAHFSLNSDNSAFHPFEIPRSSINSIAIVKGSIHIE